jgi:type IV pilus assembly protein PilX
MRSHTVRTNCIGKRARQRGAALVVGMIMLAILTLLAITAMNTSSTELVMAGNEQFRERAFQMAEAGIEQSVRELSTVGQELKKPVTKTGIKSTTQPDDSYNISSEYIGEDDDIPGFSAGKFVGLHYRIDSTGFSVRNARSTQTQGAFLPGQGGGEYTGYLPGTSAAP